MGMEGMGFGFGFGWIVMIAVWVLIGYLVFAMLRYFMGSRGEHAPGSDRALKILDERYARGEISHEEYLRMKRDITRRS